MVNSMYSLLAFVATVVVTVLLYYTRRIDNEQTHDFNLMAFFVMMFTIIDMFWGLFASHTIVPNYEILVAISVAFHVGAIVTAHVWTGFTFRYLGIKKKTGVMVLFPIPMIAGLAFIVANFFNGCIFSIDEELIYHSGNLRFVLFLCEYCYYAISLIITIIFQIKCTDEFKKKRYYSTEMFSCIPLLFGIMQFIYPDVPYLSCGYLVSVLVAFVGIVYAEYEKKVQDTSNQYKAASQETYMALAGIAKSFVSVHLFDLPLNKQHSVYSNQFIDEFIREEDGADVQITKVMQGVSEPEYTNRIVEFVDLHTLSARMRGRRVISCEFLGRNQGWCISSFIKIAEDDEGNITKVIHAVQNIDEIKKREIEYEEQLAAAYADKNFEYSEMLKMQAGGVIATDVAEHISTMNDAAARMFGFASAEEAPENFGEILECMEFDNAEEARIEYQRFLETGAAMTYYFRTRNYEGHEIYVMATPKSVVMQNGRRMILTSFNDISRSKEMEDMLVAISETDALTAINNRGSGESKTELKLAGGSTGMFCLMDIDKFKSINDTYGHNVGDKALIAVAGALKQSFRNRDIVMRLGGDEFAVFAEGITTEELATRCIRRLFTMISDIDIEEMNGKKITVSLGAVFITSSNGLRFDDVYQKADAVMYNCKEKEGSYYEFCKI